MSYPIRYVVPGHSYFVTNRTMQGRLLMTPGRIVNELIGAVLGRAIRLHNVSVHGFVFSSNHFHLIVTASTVQDFSRFMQFLLSNIAVKVGRYVNWRGKFWSRRYSCEPIVDHAAMVDRLRYVYAHGVKERLVPRVQDWPGLSSLPEALDGHERIFRWRDWSQLWLVNKAARRGVSRAERYSDDCPTRPERLLITVPPCWADLTEVEQRRLMQGLIAGVNEEHQWTTRSAEPFVSRLIRQPPSARPRTSNHTRRPKCHASTKEGWVSFVRHYRAVVAAYRAAVRDWFNGLFSVPFPAGCLRPPAWCVKERAIETC